MSFIGNNIKKIRGVKKLNQSDFADLFNLKRGAIGAYEEGRAEPQIKTVMDVAKYFGISIDDLLAKELSVNDLYRFDIFRKDLNEEVRHNLTPTTSPVDVIPVPYVNRALMGRYLEDRSRISTFSSLYLPLPKGYNYRAFEILDNAMLSDGLGPGSGDVAICVKPDKFDMSGVETGRIYLFETGDSWYLRRVESKSLSQVILKASNSNSYQTTLNLKNIEGVWQLSGVLTKNISGENHFTSRLKEVEAELNRLKSRINP